MHKFDILITKRAKQDLKSIVSYIAVTLKEPSVAQNILNQLTESISSLSELPNRCPPLTTLLAKDEIRHLSVKNYYIFYRVVGQQVRILRILNHRQSWNKLIGE